MFLQSLLSMLSSLPGQNNTAVLVIEAVVLIPVLLYASWRLWAFTIKPALHPDSPRELPYLIPWLGHALDYISNGQEIITKARIYLGDTRDPFALTLGGEKIYFLTAVPDVAVMYKNTISLTFDEAVHGVVHDFGLSMEASDAMFVQPASISEDPVAQVMKLPSTVPKCLAHRYEDFYRAQLHPGKLFEELEKRILTNMDRLLRPTELNGFFMKSRGSDGASVSLLQWAQHVLITATSESFFGSRLLGTDPQLMHNFVLFDRENWKLWYKWPEAKSKEMHAAKAAYVAAVEKYFAIPIEERGPDSSYLINAFETAERACGFSDRDIAVQIAMIYWVSNSNTFKLTFWVLSYLLFRPDLMDPVKKEIKAAMSKTGDLPDLIKLRDQCPLLNAVLDEVLRLCSASASVRVVNSPGGLRIGGKLIPHKARVLAPYRQLHLDASVWDMPLQFDPSRFLKDESLARSPSFRPFGGGATLCPGRFTAKSEVRMFISMALTRFDIELEPGQKFPSVDLGTPATGLMGPVQDHDLYLRVRSKTA